MRQGYQDFLLHCLTCMILSSPQFLFFTESRAALQQDNSRNVTRSRFMDNKINIKYIL
jgi:hypothetical protein